MPKTISRTVAAWQSQFSSVAWTVERKGLLRTVVRVEAVVDDSRLRLIPLTSGELSAELRARRDRELLGALAAFRVSGNGPAGEFAEASRGWLRDTDRSPVLRGLALCALVGRLRAENDEYEGRTEEPARLLAWLKRHGAEIALSEEEREWLTAPVDALPEAARFASVAERFASHAFALGLTPTPEPVSLPDLMSLFGFLSEELPSGLESCRIRPGRDSYLG